tara:strand:- start:5794 stop:6312 length:519 start_codon:yes stop_codon:yes gene_type:complete
MKNPARFLTLLLRHKPETIGLKLDKYGWAKISDLIKNPDFTAASIHKIIKEDNKGRFALSDDMKRVRACQGHSFEVDLQLESQRPPDVLYHGTTHTFVGAISKEGLKKMQRNHVHLSTDFGTAVSVGGRRGHPMVLEVDTHEMFEDKYEFFLSQNGVWLTDHVPPQYIRIAG